MEGSRYHAVRQKPQPRRTRITAGSPRPGAARPGGAGAVAGRRYYSPALGRWISRDPIGEDGGLALYVFVWNQAVSGNDGLGMVDTSGISPADAGDLPVLIRDPLPTVTGEMGITLVNGMYTVPAMKDSLDSMVQCTCGPLPLPTGRWPDEAGRRFAWSVSCSVRISLGSMVKDNRGHPQRRWRVGVYGHEQRHAANLLAYTRSAMVPELARIEGLYECCPTRRYQQLKADLTSGFGRYLEAESNHDHPPFEKFPGTNTLVNPFFEPLTDTPDDILGLLDPPRR